MKFKVFYYPSIASLSRTRTLWDTLILYSSPFRTSRMSKRFKRGTNTKQKESNVNNKFDLNSMPSMLKTRHSLLQHALVLPSDSDSDSDVDPGDALGLLRIPATVNVEKGSTNIVAAPSRRGVKRKSPSKSIAAGLAAPTLETETSATSTTAVSGAIRKSGRKGMITAASAQPCEAAVTVSRSETASGEVQAGGNVPVLHFTAAMVSFFFESIGALSLTSKNPSVQQYGIHLSVHLLHITSSVSIYN